MKTTLLEEFEEYTEKELKERFPDQVTMESHTLWGISDVPEECILQLEGASASGNEMHTFRLPRLRLAQVARAILRSLDPSTAERVAYALERIVLGEGYSSPKEKQDREKSIEGMVEAYRKGSQRGT